MNVDMLPAVSFHDFRAVMTFMTTIYSAVAADETTPIAMPNTEAEVKADGEQLRKKPVIMMARPPAETSPGLLDKMMKLRRTVKGMRRPRTIW